MRSHLFKNRTLEAASTVSLVQSPASAAPNINSSNILRHERAPISVWYMQKVLLKEVRILGTCILTIDLNLSCSDVLRRHQKNHQSPHDATTIPPKHASMPRANSATKCASPQGDAGGAAGQIQTQRAESPPLRSSESGPCSLLKADGSFAHGIAAENDSIGVHDFQRSNSERRGPIAEEQVPLSRATGEVITTDTFHCGGLTAQQTQRHTFGISNQDVNSASLLTAASVPHEEISASTEEPDSYQQLVQPPPHLDDLQPMDSMGILDSWLFQYDTGSFMTPVPDLLPNLLLPTWDGDSHIGLFSTDHVPLLNTGGSPSPSGRFANHISQKRFDKIQLHWHSPSSRVTRLMPGLWHNLASSEGQNLYCKQVFQPLTFEGRQKRVSRWGFDDECHQQMQLTLHSLTQAQSVASPQSAGSISLDDLSRPASTTSHSKEVLLPSTETCEVALEIYFHQFHPTLPVIHLPTFSAKGAPFPLLFVLCLLGFSILGTPSATKLVSDTFPVCSCWHNGPKLALTCDRWSSRLSLASCNPVRQGKVLLPTS